VRLDRDSGIGELSDSFERQGGEDRLLGNASWASNKCNVNNFPQVYSRNSAPAIHSWIKQMTGIWKIKKNKPKQDSNRVNPIQWVSLSEFRHPSKSSATYLYRTKRLYWLEIINVVFFHTVLSRDREGNFSKYRIIALTLLMNLLKISIKYKRFQTWIIIYESYNMIHLSKRQWNLVLWKKFEVWENG